MAECLAIMFIQPITYENHRKIFLRDIKAENIRGNDFRSAVRANSIAEAMVISFMGQLSVRPPAPLMAVLAEYEREQSRESLPKQKKLSPNLKRKRSEEETA